MGLNAHMVAVDSSNTTHLRVPNKRGTLGIYGLCGAQFDNDVVRLEDRGTKVSCAMCRTAWLAAMEFQSTDFEPHRTLPATTGG